MRSFWLYGRLFLLTALLLTQVTVNAIEQDTIQRKVALLELQKNREVFEDYEKATAYEKEDLQHLRTYVRAAEEEQVLPKRVQLDIPFTAQAPYGDWSMPWQEACEEASAIMVDYALRNAQLPKEVAKAEIEKLLHWQEQFGYGESVTIQELAVIIEQYYGYRTRVLPATEDVITKELARGSAIIAPAAGKKLQNPYFTGGGPWYHMLVITGYTEHTFITHDPGTLAGEDYTYKKDLLLGAIHNWTGVPEHIETGERLILVVSN